MPRTWENYQSPPSLVLGFHGCDELVGEAILRGEEKHLSPSENLYDWLGSGIYFWESNPLRALQFAQERAGGAPNSKGQISEPFVLGAVLKMGLCLDLSNSSALAELESAHLSLTQLPIFSNIDLPVNGRGLKMRYLDRAVFELLHQIRRTGQDALPYDTVRGTYREGSPIYPGTDICHLDHTQICVRDVKCILGYFRPIEI